MANYRVDLTEIKAAFANAHAPKLLEEFATFLVGQKQGELGDFELTASYLSDALHSGGNDVAEQFALIFSFPDGAVMGFWLADTSDLTNAPLVMFPHDDAPFVAAASFADFLNRLAAQPNAEGELDLPSDFWPDAEQPETAARRALKNWWRAGSQALPLDKVNHRFDQFIEQTAAARQAWLRSDPNARAIAKLLAPYALRWVDGASQMRQIDRQALQQASDAMAQYVRPEDRQFLPSFDQAWLDQLTSTMAGQRVPDVDLLEIQAAGAHAEIGRLEAGQLVPIPEAPEVAPLILALRLAQARAFPERGLWFSASLTIDETGQPDLRCDYRCDPAFTKLSARQARLAQSADLQAFPRSAFWQLAL